MKIKTLQKITNPPDALGQPQVGSVDYIFDTSAGERRFRLTPADEVAVQPGVPLPEADFVARCRAVIEADAKVAEPVAEDVSHLLK